MARTKAADTPPESRERKIGRPLKSSAPRKLVGAHLDPSVYEAVVVEAEKSGRSLSDTVNAALRRAFDLT